MWRSAILGILTCLIMVGSSARAQALQQSEKIKPRSVATIGAPASPSENNQVPPSVIELPSPNRLPATAPGTVELQPLIQIPPPISLTAPRDIAPMSIPLTIEGAHLFRPYDPSISRPVIHFAEVGISLRTQIDPTYYRAPVSPQTFNNHFFDRQLGVARPNNEIIYPTFPGLTLLREFPTHALTDGVTSTPDGWPPLAANVQISSTLFYNSTSGVSAANDLSGAGFRPANIPVRREDFFRSNGEGGLINKNSITLPQDTEKATYSLVSLIPTLGPPAKLYVEGTLSETIRGDQHHRLQQAYAQIASFGIGSSSTKFFDPDAFPDTLNISGPNAQMLRSGFPRNQLYWLPILYENKPVGERLHALLSIEQPDTNGVMPAPIDFKIVSRIPDAVAGVRWDNPLGHVQGATIFRGFGLENKDNSFDETVLGWGVNFSAAIMPFPRTSILSKDYVCCSFTYGEGIAELINDLHDSNNHFDAAKNGNGHFRALPVLAYYVSYTHYWTNVLRSTFIYSTVELDGPGILKDFDYHRGNYYSANLVYISTALTKNYTVFVGFEATYGQKETVNSARGDAYQLLFSVGFTGTGS
jgi:hypothetical protein